MNRKTWNDRLRDWVQGTGAPDVESELERDPDLARRAEEFRTAWDATQADDSALPTSRTSFADLDARRTGERRRAWLRRAAAVLFLVVPSAVIVARAMRAGNDDDPVVIECVPSAPAATVDPELQREHRAVPASLADYLPVTPSGIQWLGSLDDARGVSEAVGRPVLVFGFVQGCPWCKSLREVQFDDARFRALAERTVPVAVDLMAIDGALSAEWMERGYPVVELQTERGELLHGMSGPPGELDLVANLEAGLAGWPTDPPALAWTAANDLARILVASLSDERQGRLSNAFRGFAVLAESGGALTLGIEGRAGRARIAEVARAALLAAREGARTDPRSAASRLEADLENLAGTPFASDLERVLAALRERQRFPELVWRGS